MVTLEDLQQKVLEFRNERNWKQFHRPKDVTLSLVLEATELAEHFQWKSEDEAERYVTQNSPALGNELADVLYWVLLIAADFGIDLKQAVDRKLKINAEKYPVEKAFGNKEKYSDL